MDAGNKGNDFSRAGSNAETAARACVGSDRGNALVFYVNRVEGTRSDATAEAETTVKAGLLPVACDKCRLAVRKAHVPATVRCLLEASFAMNNRHLRIGHGYRNSQDVAYIMSDLWASRNAPGRFGLTPYGGFRKIFAGRKSACPTVHIRKNEFDFPDVGVPPVEGSPRCDADCRARQEPENAKEQKGENEYHAHRPYPRKK
jgi:hypothetical protein